jgi:hypothetical protein
VYEEQRQPEVLKLASRYFEAMTNGRYAKVLAPLGETRLEVEEKKGGQRAALSGHASRPGCRLRQTSSGIAARGRRYSRELR